MAYLDPKEASENLQQRVLDGIKSQFPDGVIKGKLQSLHLDNLVVKDELDSGDIREQYRHRLEGKTWAVPVYADLTLRDNATGKVVDSRKMRIADIPKMTNRYSYVVASRTGAKEYQVSNQWQLKPGVYTQRRVNGELETRFNIKNRKSFDVVFDPASKVFHMEYGKSASKIPLYQLVKTLGADDATLEKAWGKEVYEANKNAAKRDSALTTFYKSTKKAVPPDKETATQHFYDTMTASVLRPDATELTLGKPFDHVTGDAITRATQKLLRVQGGEKEDDRESLIFKDLRSVGDFAHERILEAGRKVIQRKISNKINTAKNVRDIVQIGMFNKPILETFQKNAAAGPAAQVNPVEMLAASFQTTVTGPGGIQSDRQIKDEVKFINASHLGFLDPINTPEGCFDAATEVFTARGWVAWPSVTGADLFACQVNGRLTFEPPLALVAAPFSGEMHGLDTTRVKTRGTKPLKYLVTPNHRMWSRPVDGNGYRTDRADKVHGKMRVFQVGHGPYLGSTQQVFVLPFVLGNHSSKNVSLIDLGDWAEFLGRFLSEGYVAYDEAVSNYVVKLFQSDLPGTGGCARIEALLAKLPFTWGRTERENKRIMYSLSTKQLAAYMIQFGGSFEKFIPEEAFRWPLHARERLLDALLAGDGRTTQTRKGRVWANEVYTTTSPALALGVERLMVSLGAAAKDRSYQDLREERYRDVHEIRMFMAPERHVQKPLLGAYYKQTYTGMVYCAEVPGHLMYVRRAGSIGMWLGNSSTGVTLRLPFGLKKVDHVVNGEPRGEARIPLYSLKTRKVELVSPGEASKAKIVLPDQVHWEDGAPKPISDSVQMTGGGGDDVRHGKFSDAQYVIRYPSQLFNMTSNLLPFLANTSGGRASMASRHMEQAISLVHRAPPLVQVGTGASTAGGETFEHLMGGLTAHVSPVHGKVLSVTKQGITIRGDDGTTPEVQLYNNFPTNEAKGVLDSSPIVKVGDTVKKNQVIADTNYSKGGTLALGNNLRVAYLPFKGYNFEDGVVISQTAAEKLSSTHMHKPSMPVDDATVLDKKRFTLEHHGLYSREQIDKLDDRGIIRVGQQVKPGDPLIAAMKPYQLKDRTGMAAIRKAMSAAHTDKSLRWDSEFDGDVVGVHHTKEGVTVHVRTAEPMQVGDKLAGRHGNKGICFDPKTQVLTERGWSDFDQLLPNDRICTLNQDTHRIEYQTPKRYIELEYTGPMYRFEGRRLDLMTTPNHKHFVRTAKHAEYRLESAEECFGHQRVHLRTGNWEGTELNTVMVSGRPRREGSKDHYEFCEPREYDGDDFLEFFGYWVTEGGVGGSHVTVAQRKEKNPETYEAIRQVLLRLGYEPHCSADVLVISDPRLSAWLGKFGTSLQKFIPRAFLCASKRQLRILADALFAGDGGVYYSEASNHTRYELFTSSSRLADDYQELALKLGMSANIKPQDRKDKKNIEYVVRWSLKDEVYTTKDAHYAERSERWEDYAGKVYCVEVPNHVIYVRRNGIPVWSGNCTMILPDAEMPHTADGKHIEVALNPSGVPGRMNVGQLLEVAAGKIAQKTGKPYVVQNFQPKFDALKHITTDLKKHGISDTEELFDPATKQSLGKALVGPLHMLKLVHQVEKKLSVRSGMNLPGMAQEGYDLNLQPVGGAGTGGPSIGGLDLYALLAHGAKANLREMQTYKSEGPDPQTDERKAWPSDHTKIWAAIRTGGLLPPPKPTFAYQKFTDLLRAAGVNVDKNGHGVTLSPMTNAQILELAPRALTHPTERVNTKLDQKGELKPKPGGLFDERITGGHGGRHWSRIELSEPVPNPFFEKAICSVAALPKKDFEAVVYGEKGVSPTGQITDLKAGVTGGAGIKLLLDRVDVRKELPYAQMALDRATGAKIDPALKRLKFLRALHELKLRPSDAYILHNLPVIPPIMRPITPMPNGNLKPDDLNQLYSDFSKYNDALKDVTLKQNLTDAGKQDMRAEYYDGVKALMGIGTTYAEAKEKGILHRIAGSVPKRGYFQNVLLSRRQDLSMRSTIVPEPSLGLDEVGLPKHAALDLFRPFVARKMKEMGFINNELEVPALLAKPTPQVWKALEKAMAERPVLLKRDPVLHKYSIQAFKARPVEGNAIKIHPLVTGGFNADFDGDTMSAYVPITHEAVAEAYKMFPSNNLFSDASGKAMYQPTLESALGLYKLSLVGKETGKKFSDPAEVLAAVQKGHIEMTDQVHVPGGLTTPGRVLLASAVPEPLEKHMMYDMKYRLDNASAKDGGTKGLDALLTRIAKEHTQHYDSSVNKLKDLGNGAAFGSVLVPRPTSAGHPFALNTKNGATIAPQKSIFIPMNTHSLSLKDFEPDVASREAALAPAEAKVRRIRADKSLTEAQQDHHVLAVYKTASDEMKRLHMASQAAHPNNLFMMNQAGVKPSWDQYKQMVLAPMIYRDAHDRPIPHAVTKSYSEGLDMGSYWTQMHGARRGAVMKVQEVEKPGALSKVLMQNMLNVLVNEHDCGTKDGIELSINAPDIHDRYLQHAFDHGKVHIPADTLLTPADVGQIRAADPKATIVVRSPLKCEEEHGVCQKCVGLTSGGQHYELGTNVGVQAAHAVGERAVQLTMKSFHTGGISSSGGPNMVSAFARFDNLLRLPKKLDDQATLAALSGTVDKIQPTATGVDVFVRGKKHYVGKDDGGFALHEDLPGAAIMEGYKRWDPPKVGMQVTAGQSLSDPNRTVKNPHTIFAATGSMDAVQRHLTESIFELYKGEGLKRRAIEMVVKSMGSLTRIEDPGDHDSVLRGEFRPLSVVRKMNEELIKAGKAPIEHTPALKGIDVMPRELHEDWMAKLQHNHLRETLQEAAATRGVSMIHGPHPIPGLALGAEFGLTKKDSLTPGRGHLKDVPNHVY